MRIKKISKQRKIYKEKNKDDLLQKQNDKFIPFKGKVTTYIELENRIKTLEERADNKSSQIYDSETNHCFF